MTFETDPQKVEIFTFMPISCGPDGCHRMNHRISSGQVHLQPQALASVEREEMVIHLKARLEREAVNGGNVRKKRKPQGGLAGKIFRRALEMLPRYYHGGFAAEFDYLSDSLGIPLSQFLNYRILISKF